MYPNQPGQSPDPYAQQPAPAAGTPPQPSYGQPAAPQQAAGYQQPYAPAQPGQAPYPTPQQPWVASAEQPAQPFTADGTASIDYLDQIAPQKAGKAMAIPHIPLVIIGIVGMLLVALIAIMGLSSLQPNPTAASNKLLRQVASTTEITATAEKNLKSGELVSFNSTLKSQLTSANTSLTAAMGTAALKLEKMPTGEKAASLESGQKIVDNLEEARLLGTYDRVYVRELSYRLSLVLSQLKTTHSLTQSRALKEQLSTTYDNLEPLQKQLEEIAGRVS